MEHQLIIAPCGLLCSHCDAYRATRMDDPDALERVAAKWRELNHCDEIKAEHIPCDGCMTEGSRKTVFCNFMCEIRKCVLEHKVQICSDCPEYSDCKTLSDFLKNAPEVQVKAMKQMMDAVAEVKKNMHSIF